MALQDEVMLTSDEVELEIKQFKRHQQQTEKTITYLWYFLKLYMYLKLF